MSSYSEAYCNATSDLEFIEPLIGQYDRKRLLQGFGLKSGESIIYESHNTGNVAQLFKDGNELGDAESSVGDVNANLEWYYDSAEDLLTVGSTNAPATNHTMEAGRDWGNIKNEAIYRASDFVRSYINKPIMKRMGVGVQTKTVRDFEDIIIRSTAILACASLVRPYDAERADDIEKRAYDPETGNGYLDQIKSGKISLWHEVTERKGSGIVRTVSQNASSTGNIVDTKGEAATNWDLIKVKIITGGTFAYGSASSVTYSVWVRDDTGLKTSQVETARTIDGGFQNAAHGISIRFSSGVYVADDEWEIEVSGDVVESGSAAYTIQAQRF